MAKLTDEIWIRGKRVRNRIVMPPMVCYQWAGEDGQATGEYLVHYGARARAGVGLVVVEASCVHPEGRLSMDQLGIWSDAQLGGLAGIARVIREAGAVALIQLHHAGRVSCAQAAPTPWSSSAQALSDGRAAHEMSAGEIERLKGWFVEAALRAQRAGYDGVELHCAHGYLLSQFLSPLSNRRTDAYGGSPEGRARLPVEIAQAVRAACGDAFLLCARMGASDPDIEESIVHAQLLEQAGVDLFNVSSGDPEGMLPEPPAGYGFNGFVRAAELMRRALSAPVVAVNDIRTPRRAGELLERGLADLVAIGKDLLCDAEWTKIALEDPVSDYASCRRCTRCVWRQLHERCPGSRAVRLRKGEER